MRCTSPRRVGFLPDGKTISFSSKAYSKEFATFQLPCGKCISCRLEYARQWAVRCVHEAAIRPENSFVTLTYDDAHLVSDRLIYAHFQSFMKRLRSKLDKAGIEHEIGVFVTGEYGDLRHRPHWHACLFGYRPLDSVLKYTSDRGDKVYESDVLTGIWGQGICEYGDVTFESAGYCARYAAKKLVHGPDGSHDFNPISKKSSKYAIGKRWLERFYPDVFNYGYIVLPGGERCGVPRYYEKWFRDNHPELYLDYLINVKTPMMLKAQESQGPEWDESRHPLLPHALSRSQIEDKILKSKFNQLQKHLKL